MRFTVDDKDTGTLKVQVGNINKYKEFKGLDLNRLYQWYPMNISYVLRYQEPRDRLYLYQTRNPAIIPDYDFEYRARIKPKNTVIQDIGEDMVCVNVMKDNIKLCMLAISLGLPHMLMEEYTQDEVKAGIVEVLDLHDSVKGVLEKRIEDNGEFKEFRKLPLQEQDIMLYSYATDKEKDEFRQFGKLYTMLNLMRKIAKRREIDN